MSKQRCYIDANIIAHWIIGKGGVIEIFCKPLPHSQKIIENYLERYKGSISFIEEICNDPDLKKEYEFYASHFTINELFSAIREELRSILLFSNGTPISKWRDSLHNPEIPEKMFKLVYQKVIEVPLLFSEKECVNIILDQNLLNPNYLDVYASVLFSIKEIKTQDATLITTAILDNAAHLITADKRLLHAKIPISRKYKLNIISPHDFRRRIKRKKVGLSMTYVVKPRESTDE